MAWDLQREVSSLGSLFQGGNKADPESLAPERGTVFESEHQHRAAM